MQFFSCRSFLPWNNSPLSTRLLLGVCLIASLLGVSASAHAQSQPERDAQAIAVVQQALMNADPVAQMTSVADLTATGSCNTGSTFTWTAQGNSFRREYIQGNGDDVVNMTGPQGSAMALNGTAIAYPDYMNFQNAAFYFPTYLLQQELSYPQTQFFYEGTATVNGTSLVHIQTNQLGPILTQTFSTQDWYFDPTTSNPVMVSYQIGAQGDFRHAAVATVQFALLQTFGTLTLHSQFTLSIQGTAIATCTVSAMNPNTGPAPTVFQFSQLPQQTEDSSSDPNTPNPDYTQGLTPFQTFSGSNFDVVNMSNGSVTFRIPLVDYPQRGTKLKLSYSLIYNSKLFVRNYICASEIGTQVQSETIGSPWPPYCIYQMMTIAVTPTLHPEPHSAGLTIVDDQMIDDFTSGYPLKIDLEDESAFFPMVVITSDGAAHYGDQVVANGYYFQESTDGSGIMRAGGNRLNENNSCCGIFDPDGVNQWPSSGVLRQDPDGNQISVTTSGTITDTVGRVVPAVPSRTPIAENPGSGCGSNATEVSIWNVPGMSGESSTQFTFCYAPVAISWVGTTCALNQATNGGITSMTLLQQVILPNGTSWQFAYNSYGDISQVTFPTGGSISYQDVMTWSFNGMGCSAFVTQRTINDLVKPHIWNYTWFQNFQTTGINSAIDPAGNEADHTYQLYGPRNEIDAKYYSGSGSSKTLLKEVQTAYQWSGAISIGEPSAINAFPTTITTTMNGISTSQVSKGYSPTFLFNGVGGLGGGYASGSGQTDPLTYGFEALSQQSDYGSGGSPGGPLKTTATTYLWSTNSNYQLANVLHTPSTVVVSQSSSSSPFAETDYTYDESSYLQTTGITEQHSPPASGTPLGHPTTIVKQAENNNETNPTSHKMWNDTGTLAQDIDPMGYQTTYTYDPTVTGGYGTYRTQVSNALSQKTNYVFNYWTGLKTSATDPNGNPTSYQYDTSNRLIATIYPDTFNGVNGQTSYQYADTVPDYVTMTKQISDSVSEQVRLDVDGLGRLLRTSLLTDPDGVTYTRIAYDGLGRKWQEVSPTRCDPGLAAPPFAACKESTWGVTYHQYDALSREIKTTDADGSVATNSYSGNQTTKTDEAGVQHQFTMDGLARTTQVNEVGMGWITDYQYDPLGNLLCVDQRGGVSGTGCAAQATGGAWRTRQFSYDGLSRLLESINPETGPIVYTYDNNSRVTNKLDARSIGVTYGWDLLNRLVSKSYSDTKGIGVFISYDSTSVTNGIGRRTSMRDASGTTYYQYDPMGRITNENIIRGGEVTQTISKAYYLDGSEFQVTYPSKAVLQMTEGGAGRPLSLTDVTDGINYASGATYAPGGQLAQAIFGYQPCFAGIEEQNAYDSREQPATLTAWVPTPETCDSTSITTTISTASAYILNLAYNFGLGQNDNGNVYGITNNKDTTRSQAFVYDSVNRVTDAATSNWGNAFQYDAWGNLVNAGQIPASFSPPAGWPSNPSSLPPAMNLQVIAGVNNQLSVFMYDSAGNMEFDGVNTYTFDEEERVASVASTASSDPTMFYLYDGDGDRVGKLYQVSNSDPSGSQLPTCKYKSPWQPENTTWTTTTQSASPTVLAQGLSSFVPVVPIGPGNPINPINPVNPIVFLKTGILYWGDGPLAESDMCGNLEKEYIFFGGKRIAYIDYTQQGSVFYYFSDHLGSASEVTDQYGNVQDESDYYPFGGEDVITQATDQDYKFTGKQWDTESGLNYFGARYYSSNLGRWLTPDWVGNPSAVPFALLNNPQTINLYAYVVNNPLSTFDTDGHCGSGPGGPPCSAITVRIKVTDKPKIQENIMQSDGHGGTIGPATGVGGEVTGTVTAFGKPLSGVHVNESNNNVTTENGQSIKSEVYNGSADTNAKGQFGDSIGQWDLSDGTAAMGNSLAQQYSSNVYTVTDTQTLTLTLPDGQQCSATDTRTLSNAGSNGQPSSNYTISPKDQKVTATDSGSGGDGGGGGGGGGE